MKRLYLFWGILAAILGLLVIIFPVFWIRLIVIIIGLASIGYGIYSLKFTKALSEVSAYKRSILIKSIASIVIGVLAVLSPLAIGAAAWTAMIWMLIIYLLVSAIIGFYAVALLKDTEVERKRYIIENFLLLAVAVALFLISPRDLGKAFIAFDILSSKGKVEVIVKDERDTSTPEAVVENHDGDASVDSSSNDNDL